MTIKPVRPSQGAAKFDFPCNKSSPSEGEPGGKPKPKKSSAVSVVIELLRTKGRNVRVATVAFGRTCLKMIAPLASPSARAALTYSKFRARKNSARTTMHERHPGKQQKNAEQHEEARRDDRGNDDQEIEMRERRPYLDEALEDEIGPAAEIALHRAGRDPHDRGNRRRASGRTTARGGSRRAIGPGHRGPDRRFRASSIRYRCNRHRAFLVKRCTAARHCASLSIQVGGEGAGIGNWRLMVW